MSNDDVENFILKQAQLFSGKSAIELKDLVYEDLGIGGGDALEFYRSIEERFSVDIRPVTESTVDLEASWFRKARQKTVACDPALKDIVALIEAKSGFASR